MLKIEKPEPHKYALTATDLRDGRIYESEFGDIYVGNKYDAVRAFSLCGSALIFEGTGEKFREINATLTVNS